MKYMLFSVVLISLFSCNKPNQPTGTVANTGSSSNNGNGLTPSFTWSGQGAEFSCIIGEGSTYFKVPSANIIKQSGSGLYFFQPYNNQITMDTAFTLYYYNSNITEGNVYNLTNSLTDVSAQSVRIYINSLDPVKIGSTTYTTFTSYTNSGLLSPINGKCLILTNNSSRIEGKFYGTFTDSTQNISVEIKEGYFNFTKP